MNYEVLKQELQDARYAEMTDAEAAADLNTLRLDRVRAAMSGDEVFRQTEKTEFAGLTDAKRQLWVGLCGRETIDPQDGANVDFVKWIFGDTSTTVSSLNTARTEQISRATQLGLSWVRTGDVERARA